MGIGALTRQRTLGSAKHRDEYWGSNPRPMDSRVPPSTVIGYWGSNPRPRTLGSRHAQ
ncbi:Hypothetical protein FKW44_003533 [Caligus rogercresseyi]|uniref:Uncharacterized protein n=1 Tax=Caligus rogercresseyi TaxID=217165 RepID=A0A7T8KLV7_CALRO|nr:Hypothetical protein FKW44_003533 [Caligus rogercresseyi]